MVKQGYLDKITTNAPLATKNKRARGGTSGDPENKENYIWRWGARAIEEFDEESIVNFIIAFMVDKHDLIEEEEEDENSTPGNGAKYLARKEEEVAAMRRSILKAAMLQNES